MLAGLAPGVGGPTRGRADAEMIWGEETEGRTDMFEVETLAPARYRDEERSVQFGLSATEPVVDAREEASGLVDVAGSTGNSAWRRRLAPRHRDAVRTFFEPESGEDVR